MIAADFLHPPSTLSQEIGSYDEEKVGMEEWFCRAMIVPARTNVNYPILCPGGLRRIERMGWHGAVAVCELSFFCFCFFAATLRSAEG